MAILAPRQLRPFFINRYRLLAVGTIALFSIQAKAQMEFGFGMNGMGPVERFHGSIYKPGVGFFTTLTSGSFMARNNPSKLQVGIYFDYLDAGKKRFDVELSDPPGAEGQTTLGNYSTAQHLFLRYGYALSNNVMVFGDVIIGHRKFFSQSTTGLKKADDAFEDDVERIYTSHTYRHGFGMGLRYGFGRSFGLEIRADYTRGNSATYFNLNSIEETPTAITYKSETWAHSDLFVGTLALNWKLFRAQGTTTPATTQQKSYYDNYPNQSNSNPTYRTTSKRTSTSKSKSTVKKKPVKSSKTVEQKKDEKKIDW